ncbi:Type I restriction enzyme EcoKI specificity protein [Porphyromonas crevioricanis]|uniref:Type I restriction enzyme EcoKI specificity protein n=1 Tax=Porphyromonas crevioricanis TaxID=393921 RepID=A0A2X4PM95_9PORP|nr:restriction endonuclease subunit S [Porphyromonas crevioricanis]GAD07475.1 type I restriction-modification system, specificity subunit S [Porphyromonas crevioricanis JCM 13913]SQH72658.1 Type I restriction enzyme EcoKI specificity protein [Porphyromonas crevioricanis]
MPNSHYEKFTLTGEVKCIDDEIPFDLPKGWEWERWGNIAYSIQYGFNAPASPNGRIKMVRISDIQNEKIAWENVPYCEIDEKDIEGYKLEPNDILFARTGGTVGKSFLVQRVLEQAIYAGYLIRTRYSKELSPVYLKSFMGCSLYWEHLKDGTTATAQPNCNGQNLGRMLLPIPPRLEQRRIVAKIEELMPLVEQYGKAQSKLDALNNNIREQLKKSVLQYAIEGKLVPQCEEDGTAEDLLLEIQAEKQRLYAEGKLKKKDLAHSTIFRGEDNKYYEQIGKEIFDITEEVPYDLPNSWSFCRLREICFIFTGATFRKEETIGEISGVRILRGGNILPRKLLYKPDDIFLPKDKIPNSILLRKNDIVTPAVTSLENIGKMVRIASHIQDTAVGGFVFTLRLYKDMDVLSIYLQSLLSTPLLIKFLRSISNKSGQAFYNIGKERLGLALLPIPALGEQQRITQAIENIFELIEGE